MKHCQIVPVILLSAMTLFAADNQVNQDQFKLRKLGSQFNLVSESDTISLNTEWLIPSDEYEEYQGMYTSAFEYDSTVTSFRINTNLTGLHLSSYEILSEGSASASSGKDIFLILNSNGSVSNGGISLGITKDRVRSEGFQATATHFVLGDIDANGSTDIGVIAEEIYFNREVVTDSIEGEREVRRGPFFKQEPIVWYQFNRSSWSKSNTSTMPEEVEDLPLIGIQFSPVDFVGHLQWNNYNPQRWGTENDIASDLYNPHYRQYIIDNQVTHMP